MQLGAITPAFIEALQKVVGPAGAQLHEPIIDCDDYEHVMRCLSSTYVSSIGPYVTKFENALAELTGAKYVVAVVNGTSALHTALLISGVSSGDEVLVPALSFVATANAVAYCGGIPHFIDVTECTLGVCVKGLEKYLKSEFQVRMGQCYNRRSGRVVRALVPMHTFGHPVDIEPLMQLSKEYCLQVIEDAAEGLGTLYSGKHVGTFGQVGVLSFNGNKIITTGGGGAILTNDKDLADRAKHLTTTGKVPSTIGFEHDCVAYNYRMPNLNAALGYSQLLKLSDFIDRKRKLHLLYRDAFSGVPAMRLFSEPKNARSNYWLQTILLDSPIRHIKNQLIEASNSLNINVRPAWRLLNQLPMYKNSPSAPLTISESLFERIISLPSGPALVSPPSLRAL